MRRSSILLIAATLLATVGCANSFRSKAYHLSIDWDNYRNVEIDTRNGAVSLIADPSAEPHVGGELFGRGPTPEIAQDVLDSLAVHVGAKQSDPETLVVRLEPAAMSTNTLYGWGGSIHVRVPEAVAAKLHASNGNITARNLHELVHVDTSNGRVEVADIDGDVIVDTSNGRLRLTNINGSVRADTSNGRVVAINITEACEIITSNGDVEIRDITGNLNVRTSNGDIVLHANPPSSGLIDVVTRNGTVVADVPVAHRGLLDLRTSNGEIITAFNGAQLSPQRMSKTRMVGTLNGGGDGRLTIRTSNGDIDLTLQ